MRLVQPERYVVMVAWCDALRSDGVQVVEERTWLVDALERLPDADTLRDELRAMGARVMARTRAEVVADYAGPVVFEGEAVAQFFSALLTLEVEGTPPEPQPNTSWEQLTRGGPRIGRRVLPERWEVVADPRSWPAGLPGSYRYDREGVAAQRVELVEDGYVVDLLMSRVPRRDRAVSNGHARGSVQGAWEARLAAWEVLPPRALSSRAFAREVESARRGAAVPRVLVVRSLARGRPGGLPRVSDAVWRYPDGREEPVVTLQFVQADRRTLRDVVAVGGPQRSFGYLAAMSRGGAPGSSAGLPSAVTVPSFVLVADVELTFPGADQERDGWSMPVLP
jgi:hypothetical protein